MQLKSCKLLFLVLTFCTTVSFAQKQTSGTISYVSESESKIGAGGSEFKQKMAMNMVLAFKGNNYRIEATLPSMGGIKMYRYYAGDDNEIFTLNTIGTIQYAIRQPVKLTDIKKTGNSRNILGFLCTEFTCTYNGALATGWYTEALPASISTMGNIGLPGALLRFESASTKTEATEIKTGMPFSEADVNLPKTAVKVSQDEFQKIIKQ